MALISFFDTESFIKEIISIHFVARCELLTTELTVPVLGKGPSNFDIFVCVVFFF